MRNLRERLKNPRAKRGCLACYSMGAAAPAFAYVEVEYIPLTLMPGAVAVVKEIGVCFKHTTDKRIVDREWGPWKKTPFGPMPEREELYRLVGGPVEGAKLLIGACKRGIPSWW